MSTRTGTGRSARGESQVRSARVVLGPSRRRQRGLESRRLHPLRLSLFGLPARSGAIMQPALALASPAQATGNSVAAKHRKLSALAKVYLSEASELQGLGLRARAHHVELQN